MKGKYNILKKKNIMTPWVVCKQHVSFGIFNDHRVFKISTEKIL